MDQLKLSVPYVLELIIPGLPKSLNKALRSNWRSNHKSTSGWKDVIWKLTCHKLPQAPLEKFRITLIRRGTRYLDFDGCIGSLKPILDGLTEARVIYDDSYKRTGPWIVTQELVKKGEEHIYLKVEQL